MNRRSWIALLIGIGASVAGFTMVAQLRQRRCAGAGGAWDAATRVCTTTSGALDVARGTDIVAGIAVAAVLAFMLHRASTFGSRRRSA